MDLESQHPHSTHHTTNFFDVIPSKQAFWLGFTTAILSIGTLGFIVLGSCVLGGDCSVEGIAIAADKDDDDSAPTQPTAAAAPTPTTVAAAGVPVVTDADHIRGDKDAPITIIEYSDFECPYCQRFHPTMLQVMEEYGDQVRWILRDFPLSFHPSALPAANAAECAGEQEKYWEYGDKLFENRDSLGDDLYFELAADLGLNAKQFTDCYEAEKYADAIDAEAQAGAAAGVSGTPGSFIIDQQGNATPIKGALPFSSVAAAIDKMLGK